MYILCKGLHDNVDEFEDNLTQLHEIIQKYKNSHQILIGGVFNEDITFLTPTRRLRSLENFVTENQLFSNLKNTRKTSVGPKGTKISTIDYILYSLSIQGRTHTCETLDWLAANVSDSYPILCTFKIHLDAVKPSHATVIQG